MSEKNNKMGEIFDMMFGNTEIEKETVNKRISVLKTQAEITAKPMAIVNILVNKGIITLDEYLETNKAILKVMYESMKESLLEEQKSRTGASSSLFDAGYLKAKTDKHYEDLAKALDALILENTDETTNQEETNNSKTLDTLFENMNEHEITESVEDIKSQVESTAPHLALIEVLVKNNIIDYGEYEKTQKVITKKLYESINEKLIKYREEVLGAEIHPGAKAEGLEIYNGIIAGVNALILENVNTSDNKEETKDVINT